MSSEEEYDSESEPCGCGAEECYGVDCDWAYYNDKYGDEQSIPEDHSDSGSDPEEEGDASMEVDTGPTSGPLFDLGRALASTGDKATLSFSGEATFLPREPVIFIEGVGRRAGSVRTGGGTTLVDTAVRNSWQLSPDKFNIWSDGWNEGLRAAEDLLNERYSTSRLHVRPYKFLLYKPGGHFQLHRDTEKEDGMFATMVVQLPSAHRGGVLQVHETVDEAEGGANETQIKAHDFGQETGTAHDRCQYAVHYADAEHSVTPITEGYRAVIVYSICWPEGGSPPPITNAGAASSNVCVALEQLAANKGKFIYFLQHEHTSKSLSNMGKGALKGRDRTVLNQLCNANTTLESSFEFLLARAEKSQPGYMDGDVWVEEEEPECQAFDTYNLDGKSIKTTQSRLPSNIAAYLNPDGRSLRQMWRGHRSCTYEGYLGNESTTKSTLYHKTCLFAIPPGGYVKACTELLSLGPAFDHLNEAKDSTISADDLDALLRTAWEQHLSPPAEKESLALKHRLRFRLLDAVFAQPQELIDELLWLYLKVFTRQPSSPLDCMRGRGSNRCDWLLGSNMRVDGQRRAEDDLYRITRNPALWSGASKTRALVLDIVGEALLERRLILADAWQRGGIVDASSQSRGKETATWLDFIMQCSSLQPDIQEIVGQSDKASERMWRLALLDESRRLLGMMLEAMENLDGRRLHAPMSALHAVHESDFHVRLVIDSIRPSLGVHLDRRKNWLSAELIALRSVPNESQALPKARLPANVDDNNLLAFLRGHGTRIRMPTSSIKAACQLADAIKHAKEPWSVSVDANGAGARSGVDVKKTGRWQNIRDKEIARLEQEMSKVAVLSGEAPPSPYTAGACGQSATRPAVGDKRRPIEILDDNLPVARPGKVARK